MPFAWLSMKPTSSSTNAWRRLGTPEVAPRTTHQRKPMPTMPRMTETASESKWIVQKPPSPMRVAPCVRWWLMYSDGLNSEPAAILLFTSVGSSVFAHEERHGKNKHRGHERDEESRDHRGFVIRQHEPQQEHGEADLQRFGLQCTSQNPPCRACTPPRRGHHRGRQSGDHADQPPCSRRHRAVLAGQARRASRDGGGGGELPLQDGADRPSQASKHDVFPTPGKAQKL